MQGDGGVLRLGPVDTRDVRMRPQSAGGSHDREAKRHGAVQQFHHHAVIAAGERQVAAQSCGLRPLAVVAGEHFLPVYLHRERSTGLQKQTPIACRMNIDLRDGVKDAITSETGRQLHLSVGELK